MECIGIGFKRTDTVHPEIIQEKAGAYDLLASKNLSQGHFREGITDFCEHFKLDFLQLAAFDEETRKASSRIISSQLTAFHDTGEEPGFLRFIRNEGAAFPGTFYLIFACDWNQGDPVRLEKMSLQELNGYFTRNNSWYLWIFNYSARRFFPQLGVPLIIELTTKPFNHFHQQIELSSCN